MTKSSPNSRESLDGWKGAAGVEFCQRQSYCRGEVGEFYRSIPGQWWRGHLSSFEWTQSETASLLRILRLATELFEGLCVTQSQTANFPRIFDYLTAGSVQGLIWSGSQFGRDLNDTVPDR
jgi:hypothetical protein